MIDTQKKNKDSASRMETCFSMLHLMFTRQKLNKTAIFGDCHQHWSGRRRWFESAVSIRSQVKAGGFKPLTTFMVL